MSKSIDDTVLEHYLVYFVNESCLFGHDPITGHPYITDAQCFCAVFNQYLRLMGVGGVSAQRFNLAVTKRYNVTKTEISGRNVFLCLGRKDEPETSCRVRHSTAYMSDLERKQAMKAYQRDYYQRNKAERLALLAEPLNVNALVRLPLISRVPITFPRGSDDPDTSVNVIPDPVVNAIPDPVVNVVPLPTTMGVTTLKIVGNGTTSNPAMVITIPSRNNNEMVIT